MPIQADSGFGICSAKRKLAFPDADFYTFRKGKCSQHFLHHVLTDGFQQFSGYGHFGFGNLIDRFIVDGAGKIFLTFGLPEFRQGESGRDVYKELISFDLLFRIKTVVSKKTEIVQRYFLEQLALIFLFGHRKQFTLNKPMIIFGPSQIL